MRQFDITLVFHSGPSYSCRVQADNGVAAQQSAKEQAAFEGFSAPLKKLKIKEVTHA